MTEMILRKTGIVMLNLLKGALLTARLILKLLCGVLKLFLLLFAVIAGMVLALVGIAVKD